MSDCNCNSAPGQHKDDYTYHADNCPFFLYGRIAELEQQVEETHAEALNLAIALHKRHYHDVTQWEPLPDTVGLISQIDNMSAGAPEVLVFALGAIVYVGLVAAAMRLRNEPPKEQQEK